MSQTTKIKQGGVNNLLQYKMMCKPFETRTEMSVAVKAFFDDVAKLRLKHKIPDVEVLVLASADEENEQILANAHFGDSRLSPYMLDQARRLL